MRSFLVLMLAGMLIVGFPTLGFAANSTGKKDADFMDSKIKIGQMQILQTSSDPDQDYYLYVPSSVKPGAQIFVTVHGISRNALEHALLYQPFAEKYGVVLVAPYFLNDSYQQLQTAQGEWRSDLAFMNIIDDVAELTKADAEKLYLFGYSGGGQFVHRFMITYPERVARLAVGAAGWYTFPNQDYSYPQGIGENPMLDLSFQPEQFLQIPAMVVVGDRDTERGSNLNKAASIDEQQGLTRVERAQNWIKAMGEQAEAFGLDTEYELVTLPGVAHDFAKCMRNGNMGAIVFEFLLGPKK